MGQLFFHAVVVHVFSNLQFTFQLLYHSGHLIILLADLLQICLQFDSLILVPIPLLLQFFLLLAELC